MAKIIFELAIQDAGVAAELERQKKSLAEVNAQLKKVDENSDAFGELAQKSATAKIEIERLKGEQRELKKEFAATQVPTDSLAGLRIQYSQLTNEISKLTKAERESAKGQGLIKQAASIKGEINGVQEAVGNFTGNVGNYKNSIIAAFEALQQFGGPLTQHASLLAAAQQGFVLASDGAAKFKEAFAQGVEKVREGIGAAREYISILRESKKSQAEVASVTEDSAGATESVAESVKESGSAMKESAKGATLFSRAGTVLRGVLAGLGIGLIITAVTALVGAFQKFAPVIEFVEQKIAGLSAAFDVVISRFGRLFAGDFAGAFNNLSGAIANAAGQAAQLKKEFQDLEDAQKEFTLQNAKSEAAVARLAISLKDKTKSDQARLGIAAQITKLETDNLKTKTGLIDDEINLEKRKLLLTGQLTQAEVDEIAAGNFSKREELENSFKIQADQLDRIRELLVTRTQAEGESALLLERIQNRRNAIVEEGQQKREAAEKKAKEAAERESKALEAQAARIRELAKAVRDLDAGTIANEFDRAEVEARNRQLDELAKIAEKRAELEKKIQEAGRTTESDVGELRLIEEQTQSLKAAYELQIKELQATRATAVVEAQNELRALSLEVQQLADENAEALAQADFDLINLQFTRQGQALKQQIEGRLLALKSQLADGEITRKEFNEKSLEANSEFAQRSVEVERNRASETKAVAESLRDAKIEAAKAALATELDSIDRAKKADILALEERARARGVSATDSITEREKKAVEERTAVQNQYAESVRDANKAAEDAQIEGIDRVNAAEEKSFDDKIKRIEDEKKRREELNEFLISSASVISNAVFDIEKNRIDRQANSAIEALDAEFQKRRDAAQGNQSQLEKIEADFQARKSEIEKKAANDRKRVAIKEAVIQGALAVVKALPNLFLVAAAAIAAAAQIAIINSQTFARGGIVQFNKSGMFGGRPHSRGGTRGRFDDGTQVEVEADEIFVVLNKRASRLLSGLSDLNYRHGGAKFGHGGVLDFTPQVAIPGGNANSERIFIQTTTQFSDQQVALLAETIATKTAEKTGSAVSDGLNDGNRRAERQSALNESRQV